MSKLTLHVDKELISAAKQEAAQRNVSVSKLVSDFFRNFTQDQAESIDVSELGSRTQRLAGLISDFNPDDYVEHLEKKYS